MLGFFSGVFFTQRDGDDRDWLWGAGEMSNGNPQLKLHSLTLCLIENRSLARL
jgi:hypothetical protein